MPACVGGLLAYICRPLVTRLERYWIPRGLGVALLLLMFASVALGIVNSVRAVMPTETGALELRVRALHALNRHYQTLMGLDPSWTRGNRLYQLAHRELDALLDRVSEVLALTPDERAQFVASRERGTEAASARSDWLLDQERANAQALETRARRTGLTETATRTSAGPPSSPTPTPGATSAPAGLGDILSTWIVAPVIFLFLLWDTGDIKRGLLRAVPNRLFEPALAVLADVDQALGGYVRGIFLECCSLGLTIMVFMTVVGVPLRWAIAIGDLHRRQQRHSLHGVRRGVARWARLCAARRERSSADPARDRRDVRDLGCRGRGARRTAQECSLRADRSRWFRQASSARGGDRHRRRRILFGPAGMFLAIPTITVVKVLVASSARHLKAYGLV